MHPQENSFTLLAQFRRKARNLNMPSLWIDRILKDATSSDREHLEKVLSEANKEL